MRLFRHNPGYDTITQTWSGDKILELDTEIKVLDHGFVKLINFMGTEEDIIRAARQSTQKGFLGWKKDCACCLGDGMHCDPDNPYCSECDSGKVPGDSKLLEYLYKNAHHTPFEMLELCIQVKAPIMVLRQWERHRTQSYNEWSGRYSQLKDEFYVPEPRFQDVKNKQGSITATEAWDFSEHYQNIWKEEQRIVYADYNRAIEDGISKEVARINMPVSVYTIMWAKANLRNWLGFLKLRMDPHAQLEIRLYANAVAEIIKSLWPRTYALFEEYSLYSVNLSRYEAEFLRHILKDIRLYDTNTIVYEEKTKAELFKLEERLEDNIW